MQGLQIELKTAYKPDKQHKKQWSEFGTIQPTHPLEGNSTTIRVVYVLKKYYKLYLSLIHI